MSTVVSGHATYHLDVTLIKQNSNNTSDIQIHLYAVADAGWSGSASGIGWSSIAASGTANFSGSTTEIANYAVTVGHNAAGYYSGTITAHVNATGTSTWGGPVDLAQSITLPRIPKLPGAPGISVIANSQRSVTVNIYVPAGYDDGGTTINSVTGRYSLAGAAWAGAQSGAWGTRTWSNLAPGTYRFSAFATNGVGAGPVTTTADVKVLSGAYVWNGTAWVPSLGVYVWNGTAWVAALGVNVWNGTAWVPSL